MKGSILELVLQPQAVSDIAETPDPAHDRASDCLRPGHQFDGAPVLELESVEALVLRLLQEVIASGEKGLRVEKLVEDESELGRIVADGDQVDGKTPDLGETPVEAGDGPVVVDDEDPIGCRVERGGEQGQRLAQLVFGGDLCR